jgi:hypothetical protein
MAIRIRKTGSVIASFATAQQVDISHLNDSVNIGDGTNLFGPLQNVGGTLCFPIKIMATALSAGDASASNQTSGAQKTQIVDDSGLNTVDATAVGGGVFALKVDVVSTVGGGAAPAASDGAAYVAGTSQFTPIGAARDDAATGTMAEDKYGILRMSTNRGLHVTLRKDSDGTEMIGQKAMAASIPVALASDQSAIPVTKSGTWDITNAGTFAVQDSQVIADNAGFTDGTTKLFMAGYIFDETPGTALTENDAAAPRINANRATVLTIEDGSTRARYATVTAANALKVDASGVAVPITDNAGSLTIDAAAATAKFDIGLINAVVPLMGSGIMGTGSLRVTIASDNDALTVKQATAANLNASVDVKTINAVVPLMGAGNTGTGSLRVTVASDQVAIATTPAGNVAHDAVDSGNPLKVGAKAYNALITSVANADRADLICDLQGRLITAGFCPPELVFYQVTNIANTTETTIITAGAAGIKNDIIALYITNNSTVDSTITIKDSTAGTTRMKFLVPKGGGIVIQPATPLSQTAAAANNWTATMGTTATSTDITAVYTTRK